MLFHVEVVIGSVTPTILIVPFLGLFDAAKIHQKTAPDIKITLKFA
jgi:hypothetical protein